MFQNHSFALISRLLWFGGKTSDNRNVSCLFDQYSLSWAYSARRQMEPYRFSDFPGRGGVKVSGRGDWLSESGSLYPTLDIANLVDVISENIRTKASTMTGYKDKDSQVPQLLRLFRLNGGAGPTVSYEEFVNTLAKMNVSYNGKRWWLLLFGTSASTSFTPA